ncbi:4-hydroxy-tetrahydrodipicolinate reductase [Cryomorphaceae bacterium 1068]|nr:4-hydroxy-tetrahydrodipicolinate reductase [Cryomorphaceae bacterium 1068]
MKISLIGYGRMGKRIAELAKDRGHEIVATITSENKSEINNLPSCDAAIEFTQPNSAIENFKEVLQQSIPLVTGTTGWYDEMNEVEQNCVELNGRFFYASNFSPGVFITHHLTAELSRIMNDFNYTSEIEEWHHTGKKDAPSGTATTLAKEVISENKNYTSYHLKGEETKEGSLPIAAYREGDVKGTHIVRFKSEIDSIEIKHEAFSRDGFALGAIMAAEFLVKQKPGFYSMNNLIQL